MNKGLKGHHHFCSDHFALELCTDNIQQWEEENCYEHHSKCTESNSLLHVQITSYNVCITSLYAVCISRYLLCDLHCKHLCLCVLLYQKICSVPEMLNVKNRLKCIAYNSMLCLVLVP